MEQGRKKLMVLGATVNQLPLIVAAKREGYQVVVCDWTTTNPGIPLADKHYQVSTLDREAVLQVALAEQIDGIISNSEPAMENVAFIATKLHLVGNPEQSITSLLSKGLFRQIQRNAGAYAPQSIITADEDEYLRAVKTIGFPLIVKPMENSGSRGTTKIENDDPTLIHHAFTECSQLSRNRKVVVEEYVVMPTLSLLDGDIFIHNGEILWDGLFHSQRKEIAPLVPTTQSYPLRVTDEQLADIKETLRNILAEAGVAHGEYNIEMYYTTGGKLFVIEINPRQGGNGIPALIKYHCGVDMHRLLVTTAINDNHYWDEVRTTPRTYHYISREVVFSDKAGTYAGLYIDPTIAPHVTGVQELKRPGDSVRRVANATSAVAYVDLQFDTYEQQHNLVPQLTALIRPLLSE